MINTEALEYLKLWHEQRGYDHEYLFTTQYGGQPRQMSEGWADYFVLMFFLISSVAALTLTSLRPPVLLTFLKSRKLRLSS